MRVAQNFVLLALAAVVPVSSSPAALEADTRALALSPYAPRTVSCPSTPLVRPASDISDAEKKFVAARKQKADTALKAWISKTSPEFGTGKLPLVGLAVSGGGYRSMLTGAGVVQGLDARDSNTSVSGLLAGITYQAGLSGGSWLLSSVIGNNYPTVSKLSNELWQESFEQSLLLANILYDSGTPQPVLLDLSAKQASGFRTVLNDAWGRLLSFQFLQGQGGGVRETLSGITSKSTFTQQTMPFPIITALGVETFEGECSPDLNATQYELTPYEFGSWDQGVAAFTQTKYLGSRLSNGKPSGLACINNFDNLGYAFGTSSNLFNVACVDAPQPSNDTDTTGLLIGLLDRLHQVTFRDLFAVYRNPFRNYPPSTLVSKQTDLSLVDGGLANQNVPLWPFIQPSRAAVDVLLVSDNSADTESNYPNGTALITTFAQAQQVGLSRMPAVPAVEVFVSRGYDRTPVFFGCDDKDKLTIVYIPNANYTFESGVSTFKLQYSREETRGLIANGVQVVTKGGDREWAGCLACAVMMKTGERLAGGCGGCFEEYCYRE